MHGGAKAVETAFADPTRFILSTFRTPDTTLALRRMEFRMRKTAMAYNGTVAKRTRNLGPFLR